MLIGVSLINTLPFTITAFLAKKCVLSHFVINLKLTVGGQVNPMIRIIIDKNNNNNNSNNNKNILSAVSSLCAITDLTTCAGVSCCRGVKRYG